jgi:hypothetical protein
MSERETIRSAMNAAFLALPDWLVVPFLPMKETLTILFDLKQDQLARDVISAIPQPASWTQEQLQQFDTAKASIIAGIDSLIADTEANDPMRTPEAIAQIAAAEARRVE